MTIFSTIYRENRWNGRESLSGPGSGSASTLRIAAQIVALVEELGVQSVLDVGCGDSFWLPELPGYLGVDVAPEAIRRAKRFHPDRSYALVKPFEPLPAADLVLCRDVFQHLSWNHCLGLIERIQWTGASWLLASTYLPGEIADIETGEAAWRPNLSQFGLGEPERIIDDGYDAPDVVRDPEKKLGLWRL